eukprot:CAMPEP_0202454732 /NCGR_PEP_ID=MMETSP1360-20130828/12391_1 /ASSEMBLY_ACC=CAM_ASM_000848 /TAXON_ID=515479 /ORGANISM="Licmophora paradoxa, Strain CCMP2313" /LENGTH=30 /DNA_ID= /DNA_START= /DNA_END= /DNA_ORIENTATION=
MTAFDDAIGDPRLVEEDHSSEFDDYTIRYP